MKVLASLFAFASFFGFAQSVELTVQTGHSAAINDALFSPFDDYVATAGSDNKVVVWDFATSKQYKVLLGHSQKVNKLSFHPDNDVLLSASDDSTIRFWNFHTGELLDELRFDYKVPTATFSNSGNEIYIGGPTLLRYSYPEMVKETVSVSPKKRFTTIGISDSDSLLIVGGEDEHFGYLFDIEKKQMLKKFTHSMISASFDSYEQKVYFSTNNGLAYSYDLVTTKKYSLSTDWMLVTINDIIADSSFVYTADDYGVIRRLEKRKWFQSKVLRGKLNKTRSLALSNDGRFLLSSGNNRKGVIWDLEELRVVSVLRGTVDRINDIMFSEEGTQILIAYENGSLRCTDLITNQSKVNKLALDSEILSKIGGFSVVKIIEFKDDRAKVKALYKQSSIDLEGVYDVIREFDVEWNLKDNLLEIEEVEQSENVESYIKDLKRGVLHDTRYFLDSTLRYDKVDSMDLSIKVGGNELLVDGQNYGHYSLPMHHSDLVTCVDINEKFGFVATASWDGMIRFWNIKDHKLMTIFGAFGDGQFVYINPEGYYFSSKHALEYIGFSMDNQMFSFEQFDLKFNRPDLVIKELPYYDEFYEQAFEKAYKKRLDKLGLTEGEIEISKNIPKVHFENNVEEALLENELTIKLKCTDNSSELDRLYIHVNGVPEFGRFGKEINGNVFEEELKIKLNPGTNFISCYVTNEKNISSLKKVVKIEAPRTSKKSDLYILSIGVSSYEQHNYNLSYASKDARDIKEYFEDNGDFENVKTQMLLDAAATHKNILSMREYFADATENDVVILFVAGHGVLDDELDYYFAPHDMDFSQPAQFGVPFEAFDEILDNTKCRKKIMFLDACHSGEIDKDEVIKNYVADEDEKGDLIFRSVGNTIKNIEEVNSFELSKALFADMRTNNGSTVISSSGGAEYAIEGEQWNNGVFTYSLLKGLKDRKADSNRDRKVTLSELQNYVQQEVHKLTKGLQTPTSRVENLNYDFVVN